MELSLNQKQQAMKTFNIKAILKIMLVFICTSFYPINNNASESLSGNEYKGEFVEKVKDSQSIEKDTLSLKNWYDNLSDTINDLTKSSPSADNKESLLLTDNAKNQNNIIEKVNPETKPRKLAYVLIDVLIKRFSLMLNK